MTNTKAGVGSREWHDYLSTIGLNATTPRHIMWRLKTVGVGESGTSSQLASAWAVRDWGARCSEMGRGGDRQSWDCWRKADQQRLAHRVLWCGGEVQPAVSEREPTFLCQGVTPFRGEMDGRGIWMPSATNFVWSES